MPKRAQRFREALADVRTIPVRRDVFRRRRMVERVPLAKKLGVGHFQFECVALETMHSLSNCPGALLRGALLSDTYAQNGS
jgi:hypothetical protein